MGFLGDFADQLGSQLGVSENTDRTLNDVDGKRYGALGDFAAKFDHSAERRYLEEGYLRRDPFNIDSKQFEILTQAPQATVLVKKRMFSSVADNYHTDYMDKDERLYFRAMKLLFQNKCELISSLEKISKIQKIAAGLGDVDDQLMSLLFTIDSNFNLNDSSLNRNEEVTNYKSVIDRLRTIYAFNKASNTTSWIADSTNLFRTEYGQGTGVIEITNFTNFDTTVTTDTGRGRASLSIFDPYEAMLITEYDIEKALSDASNLFNSSNIFQLARRDSAKLINDLTSRLNSYRKSRGASEIKFYINTDTLLGKKVTAVIEGIGVEIPFEYNVLNSFNDGAVVPPEYLINGSDIVGYQGLNDQSFKFGGKAYISVDDQDLEKSHDGKFNTESELKIFQALLGAIFNKISLETNSKNALYQFNNEAKYARKKLRFNFLGKLIIQPMDAIHFYINSKSQFDEKVLAGLKSSFAGSDFLSLASSTIQGLANSASLLFGVNNMEVYAEKSAFVGPNFPSYLWATMRSQFVNEKEGTHIFAGIVSNADSTYTGNSFQVSITAEDNCGYLTKSKVSFKPGVDAWSGSLYNPITPFKTRFDSISASYRDDNPQLLDENVDLLGSISDSKHPLTKYKTGPHAGKPANELNYFHDQSLDPITGRLTRVFHAPDGLVYKWKEGIGVFTQYGSSLELNDPYKVGSPPLTKDAFANQDIMNILSLLITGTPYNFATYYKGISAVGSLPNDAESNQNASVSFNASIKEDLEKTNALWGNFIPFKNFVMDQSAYAGAQRALATITENSSLLESKLRRLAELNADVNLQQATFINKDLNQLSKDVSELKHKQVIEEVNILTKQVEDLIKDIRDNDESYFIQTGEDIAFSFSEFLKEDKATKYSSKFRRSLRRQLNYITRRMSYNVRANQDKNLFIVDDSYDKDYDLAAFTSELESPAMYNNQYLNVLEKVTTAAQIFNLEVFADTQGHIRARSPQYNRMPSSIFYKMMYQKRTLGIQLFPDFLNNIFEDQLSSLQTKLEVIEDYIRLDCALLDKFKDTDAEGFLTSFGNQGAPFKFLSSEETGMITNLDVLKEQALPNAPTKTFFLAIENQATNTRDTFSTVQRYEFIKDTLNELKQQNKPSARGLIALSDNIENTKNIKTTLDQLISRIEIKSGIRFPNDDLYVLSTTGVKEDFKPNIKYIDIFKITQDLTSKLSERYKLIKLFYSTLKNSAEFASIDNDEIVSNDLLTSGTYANGEVPEIFEHMIEDESYDDYGPGSGKRYIIKNSQIKGYTIKEDVPSHVFVEVEGVLNKYNPAQLPPGLNSFPGGGNGMTTALAIDYDLWRNYGWRDASIVKVPFLSNPETQCAPYAVSLLSRARKEILSGSITIVGNEYMQPGEVVYLENRGLLFYVTSVRHTYTEGRNFTTSLTLTYGHAPGEYIPTTLDTVGKLLYNNRDTGSVRIERQNSSFNENNIGCFIFDPNSNELKQNFSDDAVINGQSYGPTNAQLITSIYQRAAYTINKNNSRGTNIKASLELRVYYDKKLSGPNEKLYDFAWYIKALLTRGISDDELPFKSPNNEKYMPFDSDTVLVAEVDLNSDADPRSPSQKCYNYVRNITQKYMSKISGESAPTDPKQKNSSDTNTPEKIKQRRDKLRSALTSYVVDCWLKFEILPPDQKNESSQS